jgi:hypothetical protein
MKTGPLGLAGTGAGLDTGDIIGGGGGGGGAGADELCGAATWALGGAFSDPVATGAAGAVGAVGAVGATGATGATGRAVGTGAVRLALRPGITGGELSFIGALVVALALAGAKRRS